MVLVILTEKRMVSESLMLLLAGRVVLLAIVLFSLLNRDKNSKPPCHSLSFPKFIRQTSVKS